jgi:hypothetical protein
MVSQFSSSFNNKNIRQSEETHRLNIDAPFDTPIISDLRKLAITSLFAPILSSTQRTAAAIYQQGFNCIPVIYGTKIPYLQHPARITRLYHDETYPFQANGIYEAFAGRCNIGIVMGRTSGKSGDPKRKALFVIDCDTQQAYEFALREFKKRDIPIYGTKTKRGAHFYFYARREVANIGLDSYHGVEIKGVDSIVIAPPSVIANAEGVVTHRYTHIGDAPEPPFVEPTKDLDFFDYPDGTHIEIKFVTSGKSRVHSGLTNRTNETITSGHTLLDGKRRRIYSAAREMWDKGYSETQIKAALTLAASKSPKGYLDNVLQSVTQKVPCNLSNQPRMNILTRAQAYIKLHPFTGRTADTDSRVFLALAKRALEGSYDGNFRASYREIQDLTETIGSLDTIQKSIRRLIRSELIEYVNSDHISHANCYRFGTWYKDCTLGVSLTSEDSSVRFLYHHTDAAQRGALNNAGLKLYDTLCSTINPLTLKEIAARSGVKLRTAKHYLNKNQWLRKSGLVKRVADGWIAEYAADSVLDELIARPAQTLGKTTKRKVKNKIDRAQRATHLFVKARFHDDNSDRRNEFIALLHEYATYRRNAAYPEPTRRIRKSTSKPQEKPADPPKNNIETLSPRSEILICPNCGQTYAAIFGTPPDKCDYCRDMTTWKPIEQPSPHLDPLVQFGIDELGGVLDVSPPVLSISQSVDTQVRMIHGLKVQQAVELSMPISQNTFHQRYQHAINKNMAMLRKGLITADQYRANGREIDAWCRSKNADALEQFCDAAEHHLANVVTAKSRRR